MLRPNQTRLAACIAGFLLTSAYLPTRTAAYAERRLSGHSICDVLSPDYTMLPNALDWGLKNVGAPQLYTCSIPSDSTVNHTLATVLNVHGEHSTYHSGTTTFQACVTSAWGSAYSCGATTTITAAGAYGAALDRSSWNNSSYTTWFPYLRLGLNLGDNFFGVFYSRP